MTHRALFAVGCIYVGIAGTQNVTAQGYNLFNPTPREKMRDLSADRPDSTETPITVDAGHVQIEASLFGYSRNRVDGILDETNTWMSTNLKLGLTDSSDIQFVFDAYTDEQLGGGGGVDGFSDLEIRYKWNVWGNDGRNTAFAIFPFVKIPTGTDLSNDEWEGGLILPFAATLTDRLSVGLQGEIDYVYDDEDDDHGVEFLHTVVLGLSVTEKLGTFIEYVGVAGDSDYQAFASGGVTYSVTDDLMFDVGLLAGLNEDSDDLSVFTGFTVRF